jgi:hypothetical protein
MFSGCTDLIAISASINILFHLSFIPSNDLYGWHIGIEIFHSVIFKTDDNF